MKRTNLVAILVASWWVGGGTCAFAQLPFTDLQTVTPAFAKAGETIEVTITGTNTDDITGLRFNDARITAEPVRSAPDDFFPEGQVAKNRFTLSIPATVEPGTYEVRSLGYFGLSTARPFLVLPKDSPEIVESGDLSKRDSAMELPVETGVRGQIDGGKRDWFKFQDKKGERLLIEVWAERLDSKLDGQLVVTDTEGRELESQNDYFGRDPMASEMPFWTAPVERGRSMFDIQADMASNSAVWNRCNHDEAEYIRLLHEAVLHKQPTQEELDYWTYQYQKSGGLRRPLAEELLTAAGVPR